MTTGYGIDAVLDAAGVQGRPSSLEAAVSVGAAFGVDCLGEE